MRPVLFHMGPLPVFAYGVMVMLGVVTATWTVMRRGAREGIASDTIMDLAVWVVVGGVAGGRILFVILNWRLFQGDLIGVFRTWEGGLVLYGALMGATIGGLYRLRRTGQPVIKMMDIIAPAVPLGVAFGRIGCLFNGCCWGRVCGNTLGVRFPRILDAAGAVVGSPAYQDHLYEGWVTSFDAFSLPVYPTQLISSLLALSLCICLHVFFLKRKRDGTIFAWFMIGYGVNRFVVEFLRDDTPDVLWGMTFSQCASILLIIGGAVYWYWTRNRAQTSAL